MGRRKSKRKPLPKRKQIPLDKVFNCPFCNHEKSCEVDMEKLALIATITCGVCFESFSTTIHHLSEPIDVYNEWIDACEEAN